MGVVVFIVKPRWWFNNENQDEVNRYRARKYRFLWFGIRSMQVNKIGMKNRVVLRLCNAEMLNTMSYVCMCIDWTTDGESCGETLS